ncbi:MAG: translation factor GTPase family protein [Ruminococcus sp.]|nr:translation factor GTPase family protein [Ruminococcus sp.]
MKKIAVGILAHVDSGKTTLSEALMYCSGNIGRLGRVDHKDSFLDNFALERERGITIFSKQALLNYGETRFTLLDTPGHVDFSAETERTMSVLDYAVLVISGTDGVQSHTQTLWKLLGRYNIPCFIFVNKMDLQGASKETVFTQLKTKLSDCCVDFGDTEGFYENIALCHEDLLEKYEDGALDGAGIAQAVKSRRVFPVMYGSALKLEGVEDFLECIDKYTLMPSYGGEFAARVFKISEDSRGNRLTHMKITGGTLKVRDVLTDKTGTKSEKVNQIRLYSGEKFSAPETAEAGTVCAVTGITFAGAGDGLGAESGADIPVLEPVLTYSMILPDGIDVHTALSKMRILEAEDPQLNMEYNERFGEIQVRLMGDIQLEILRRVIHDRFGFDAGFGEGSIIYKETVADTVEGVGHFEPLRHYAEVHLLIKPLPRNSGVIYKSECSRDSLDINWQRLILTHLYEKTHLGVLTGSPLTDVEISLVSGRAHAKHTEGGDFRQATYRAVRQGLMQAKSVLLEPFYEFTLEVPVENTGRAMNDIQLMNGSFDPPETSGSETVISGTAPVSKMRGYAREVMQYTHGAGRLSLSLKGYSECQNADEVIARFAYDPGADLDNPCDSVFCSHGAGHNVKWNEVKNYMHLPSALNASKPNGEAMRTKIARQAKTQNDFFAADKELMRIFEQTYGPVKQHRENELRRHFKPESDRGDPKYRKKAAPSYDGTEYVLVDGYNVIFSWENLKKLAEDNIDGARFALINILCNYQGFKKCELILVFDAYKVKGNSREVEQVNGISIVYTKEAETADMYIEKTSHKLAKNNRVRVVTSDGMEQLIILGNGALRVPSRMFYDEVKEAQDEIRRLISKLDNNA